MLTDPKLIYEMYYPRDCKEKNSPDPRDYKDKNSPEPCMPFAPPPVSCNKTQTDNLGNALSRTPCLHIFPGGTCIDGLTSEMNSSIIRGSIFNVKKNKKNFKNLNQKYIKFSIFLNVSLI